ncbi:MAG: hypothetical protein KBT03_03875 [Bacteroidales bacterium]|nr:hypothetical protein [Candidatus Scybalousia scybalohippi]
MACKNICKLCDKLILSENVSYNAPNLWVTIPSGNYYNGEKYCIVVAQNIPAETPVDAPVQIVVSGGTQLYPLTSCDCKPVTARALRTRTKYSTVVETSAASGVFRLLGKLCGCMFNSGRGYIDGNL